MRWRDFWDNPEELIIDGICSSIFLYWIVGWWVLLIAVVSGLLWRAGGVKGGNKLFRRIGVPLVICSATMVCERQAFVFLAIPFMVWLAPSYGVDSWLFKRLRNNFLTRLICFMWYWTAFAVFYGR